MATAEHSSSPDASSAESKFTDPLEGVEVPAAQPGETDVFGDDFQAQVTEAFKAVDGDDSAQARAAAARETIAGTGSQPPAASERASKPGIIERTAARVAAGRELRREHPDLVHNQKKAETKAYEEKAQRDAAAEVKLVSEHPEIVLDKEEARTQADAEQFDRDHPELVKDYDTAVEAAYDAKPAEEARLFQAERDREKRDFPKRVQDEQKAERHAYKEDRARDKQIEAEKIAKLEHDPEVALDLAQTEQNRRERAREGRDFPFRVTDEAEAQRQAFVADHEAGDLTNLDRQFKERARLVERNTVNGALKTEMLAQLEAQRLESFKRTRDNYAKYTKSAVEMTSKLAVAAAKGEPLVISLTNQDKDMSSQARLRRLALGITDNQNAGINRFGGTFKLNIWGQRRGPALEERSYNIPGMPDGKLVEVVRRSTGELVRQSVIVGNEKAVNDQLKSLRRTDLGSAKKMAFGGGSGTGYSSELATMGTYDQQLGKAKQPVPWFIRWFNFRQE